MAADDSRLRRRAFLRASAIAGGGLLVACNWGGSDSRRQPPPGTAAEPDEPQPDPNAESFQPNAFIRISADNYVTIIVGAAEIGQGTMTAIPMIVAEELDADWERVSWEQSPASTITYGNPFWQREGGLALDGAGLQITAASTTVRGYYPSQRAAGAAVREMLISAAASRWGVDASALRTENSHVIDDATGRRLSYGELAAAAAEVLPPLFPTLKDPSQFRLIGQRKRRLDGAEKSDGSLEYGFDKRIPNMLTVVVARPPQFGATVLTFDDTAAKQVPGVQGVYRVPSGVAVAAKDFWSAERGRKALVIEWNTLTGESLSTDKLREDYRQQNTLPGRPVRMEGAEGLLGLDLSPTLEAEYDFPFLAHAPMEPLNVTIDYRGSSCEIWCGTQWPDMEKLVAAAILGLPPEAVTFHTLLSGGGFGRRANIGFDFMQEAAHVARAVQAPLKVVWTREDDIRGGYYRPFSACRLSGRVNQGKIESWTHRVARQTLLVNPLVEAVTEKVTEEVQATQGAEEMPYDIPNVRVEAHNPHNGVPVLWMRSVANAVNVFAVETFFDDLARQAGCSSFEDVVAMRRELLASKPRHRAVLDAVMAAAGAPAAGVHRGLALCHSYQSSIAQLVEASVAGDGTVSIHRVVSAVDCGTAINPDLVEAQIESGVVFALSTALFGEISLQQGEVQQSNFHDYPVLRMYQTPQIETVLLPSDEAPGGVGELGVPCVAPALVNALYWATGKSHRSLPLNNFAHLRFK